VNGPRPRRTPAPGVLFRCFRLLTLVAALSLGAADAAAQSLESEDNDRVVDVLDGRTLVFERLGRLRLIGLHVPAAGQPLAEEARDATRQAVLDRSVRVVTESRAEDEDGTLLGHVFLADGRNLQERLLEQGLATVTAEPPNLFYLDRFLAVERRARDSSEGLWGMRHLQPIAAERLGGRHAGYRFVRGRILRAHSSNRYVYLNLGDRFAVTVRTSDWVRYFEGPPEDYLGREVLVRGHVTRYRHGLQVRIAHPSMLEHAGPRP
jgi:micrococcal nuclease